MSDKHEEIIEFECYNFRLKKYESLRAFPDDWRDYIPQDEPVQGVYEVLLGMGKTSVQAAEYVLTKITEVAERKAFGLATDLKGED